MVFIYFEKYLSDFIYNNEITKFILLISYPISQLQYYKT